MNENADMSGCARCGQPTTNAKYKWCSNRCHGLWEQWKAWQHRTAEGKESEASTLRRSANRSNDRAELLVRNDAASIEAEALWRRAACAHGRADALEKAAQVMRGHTRPLLPIEEMIAA